MFTVFGVTIVLYFTKINSSAKFANVVFICITPPFSQKYQLKNGLRVIQIYTKFANLQDCIFRILQHFVIPTL